MGILWLEGNMKTPSSSGEARVDLKSVLGLIRHQWIMPGNAGIWWEGGIQSYAAFSRKTGLPPSTLHRLEQGVQSFTLGKLEKLLWRLKCKLPDVFPGGGEPATGLRVVKCLRIARQHQLQSNHQPNPDDLLGF